MKYVAICLVIIVIILAFNVYTSLFIGQSSQQMLGHIGKAREAAHAGDIVGVSDRIAKLKDEWETVESRWEMLVDHREVEKVDTLLTRLAAMAGEDKMDELLPELEELAFFLKHIDEKHKIRAENIF